MEIVFNKVSFNINVHTPLEKNILNNVSFELESGKKYAFLGKSGSGKTCVAELINASFRPSSGVVQVLDFINDGKNIKNVNKLRFMVGYVTKNKDDMFFNKKVKDELVFGLKYFRYKISNKSARSKDVLKIVGLDESYLDKRIDDLTYSEVKKVQLASVLIYNPKILVLDEPTIHMNKKDKKEMLRILNFINEKYGKTIILLSRDVNFIYEFNSQNFVLNEGKIVMEGHNDILRNKKIVKYGLSIPDIVMFIEESKKKGIILNDYVDIKDLIKGVCNNVL